MQIPHGMWSTARRLASVGAFAVATAAPGVRVPPWEPFPMASAQGEAPCATWVGDYVLAVRVRLEDTPFGAGNGTYDAGSGKARLRVSPGADGTKVELLSYETHDQFTIESHVLFIGAKVTNDSVSRATPDANGVAATGALRGTQVVWTTPVNGFRTDGTLDCEGSGCGNSGVPPKGRSTLHIPPTQVSFAPFRFESSDLATFHMAYSKVSHTEMPKQTAFTSIAGRRISRTCSE
jgi:hypothetical protein